MTTRPLHHWVSTTAQLVVLRTVITSSIIEAVLCGLLVIPGGPYGYERSWQIWLWLATLLVTLVHQVGMYVAFQAFSLICRLIHGAG